MAFTDNFDRANASLEASPTASGGGNWVHDGLVANALQIASNVLRCNTTDGTGSAYKTPNQGSADHYVQYKVNDITTSTGPFACCRLADRSNFVGIRTGSDGPTGFVQVYRRVSGSLTNLYFSASGTVAVGDIIRLECSGTNFTVKKNGVVIFGPTAIGSAGLTSSDTGVVARTTTGSFFDDFEAGALSGDTSGSPSGEQLLVSVGDADSSAGGAVSGSPSGNEVLASVGDASSEVAGFLPPFLDNFNRTDGWLEEAPAKTASGGWDWTWDTLIAHGGSVFNNILYSGTADGIGSAYKTPSVGSADHYVQYKVPAGLVGILDEVSSQSIIACRLENRSNFVGMNVGNKGSGNGQIIVVRNNAGVYTFLYTSGVGEVTTGDTFRLECVGTNWTLKKNGSVLGTGAIGDATLTNVGTGVVFRGLIAEVAEDFEAGVSPAPAVYFSDDFNRANGALESTPTSSSGGTWVHDGRFAGLAINSNQLRSTSVDESGSAYKCDPSPGVLDHFVEFTAIGEDLIYGPGACCRMPDHNQFVGLFHGATTAINFGHVEVWRETAGLGTIVQLYNSGDGGYVDGDVLRLAAVGSDWYVFKNGNLMAYGPIGATLTSTDAGIIGGGSIGNFFDDFVTGPQTIVLLTGEGLTASVGDATGQVFGVTGEQLLVSVGSVSVVVPAIGFGDNFNRADASLEDSPIASGGWTWVHDGLIPDAFEINSNRLRCNTTEFSASVYKTPSQGSRDHFVEAKVVTVSMSGGPLIACRIEDNFNYVGLRIVLDEIEVYRRVEGTSTKIFTMEPPYLDVGDTVRLACSGPKFFVYVNDHLIYDDFIGALFTSWDTGIVARGDTGTYYDDFFSGHLGINEFLIGNGVIVDVGNAESSAGCSVDLTGEQVTVEVGDVEISASVSVEVDSMTLYARVGWVDISISVNHSQTGENLEVTVYVGDVAIYSPDFAWDETSDMPDGSLSNYNKTLTAPAGGFAYANSLKTHSAIYGFFEAEFRSFYAEVTFTAENGGRPYGRVGLISPGFPPGFEIYLELETGNIVDAADGYIFHVHMFPRISNGDVVCIHFYPSEGWVRFKLNGGPWNNDAVIPWTPRQDYYANFLWLEADKCGLGDNAVVYETPHSSPYFTKMVQVGTGPRLRRNRLNDLPVFDFNNSPLRTNASDNISSGRREIAAVFKGGAGSGNRRIVDQSPEATGIFVDTRNSGTEVGTGDRVAAGAGNYISYNKDDWTIFFSEKPGTFKNLSVNGGPPTTFTGQNNAGTSTNPVTVGARNVDATLPLLNTEVAEVIVRGGLTGLRDEIEGYLAHKWGLAYLLPDSHLYKYDHPEGEIKVIDTTANWAIYAEIGHERLSVTVTATLNTGDTPFAYPPPTEPYVDDWASYDPEKTIVFSGIPAALTVSVGSVTVPQASAYGWDNRTDVPDGFLTNGDKTETATPSAVVYSTAQHIAGLSGLRYAEVTFVGSGLSASSTIGISCPDFPEDDVVLNVLGEIIRNGVVVGSFDPWSSGTVVGVLLTANGMVQFFNLASFSSAVPLTGGGRKYAIHANIQASTNSTTINTGETPFATVSTLLNSSPWLSPNFKVFQFGFQLTASRGTPTIVSHNTIYLEGLELTAEAGNIVTRHDKVTLVGLGLTVSLGSVTRSLPISITETGFGLTASVGSATSKATTGVIPFSATLSMLVSRGSVTVTFGVGQTLSGNELLASVGNVSVVTKANVSLTGEQLTVSTGNTVGSVPFRITETGFGLTVSTKSPTVNVGVSVTLTKTTQLTVLRGTLSYDEPWTPAPAAGSEVWTMIEGHN